MTLFRLILFLLIGLAASEGYQVQADQVLKAVVNNGKLFLCDSKGNIAIFSLETTTPSSIFRIDVGQENSKVTLLWDITSEWFYITGSPPEPMSQSRSLLYKIPISQLEAVKFTAGEAVSASKIASDTLPPFALESALTLSHRRGLEVHADFYATNDLLYMWVQQGNLVTQWIWPPTAEVSGIGKRKLNNYQPDWSFPFVAFPSGSAIKVIPAYHDALTVEQAEFGIPTGIINVDRAEDDPASKRPGLTILIVDKRMAPPRWFKARVVKNTLNFTSQEGNVKAVDLEGVLKRALNALEKVNPLLLDEQNAEPAQAPPITQETVKEEIVPEEPQSDLEPIRITML